MLEARELACLRGERAVFAGLSFRPGGPVDGHHDQARFTWHLGRPGEEPAAIGFDVAELDSDGRIRQVLGFLDKV